MEKSRWTIELPSFDVVLAAIIILWLNAGMFTYVQARIPSIVMYGIVAIWFLIAIRYDELELGRIIKTITQMLPSLILLLIAYTLTRGALTNSYLMFCLYVFIILSIREFYLDNGYGWNFIYKVWQVDVIAVVINTFYQITRNPLVIRNMSVGSSIQSSGLYGCASFSNILCYMLLAIYLFSRILNKKVQTGIGTFVAFIALVVLVFQSQIALLIGFLLIGIIAIVICNAVKSTTQAFLIGVPVIALFAIIWYYLPDLLTALSQMQWVPELIQVKLMDVVSILSGSTTDLTDAGLRLEHYQEGINSFINNPLFGSYGDGTNIGGHSTWFDFFGLYGLFAFVFVVWHIKLMKTTVDSVLEEESKYIFVLRILFSAFGFLDPILFHNVYLYLLLIVPIMSRKSRVKSEQLNDDGINYEGLI